MLILNRFIGQSILINEDILIKFISRIDNKIQLGFAADHKYNIVRLELLNDERLDQITTSILNRNKGYQHIYSKGNNV